MAVFLDRDGVIIHEKRHLAKVSEVEFIEGASEAIKLLNKKFLVIVISNQSVVARGIITEKELRKINSFIKKTLAEKGAKLDAVYYCPHHPEFSGDCECRKPKTGMLLEAQKKFGIDFSRSYFVGDKTVDIQAGKTAGCKTILVQTGFGGSDKKFVVKPDFIAKDILEAVKLIQKVY